MYGIVNKAIQGLITENYGEHTWQIIKEKSGIQADAFLSSEPYPDEVTYSLAGTAAQVLNLPLNEVLIAFGEYWILKTGVQHYGSLMKAGGTNLREFLINLPNFHSRVMLIYPNLTPPEFKVEEVDGSTLLVHYFSQRQGLKHFVVGLLMGLGKMYDIKPNVDIIHCREEGYDHDVFKIKW